MYLNTNKSTSTESDIGLTVTLDVFKYGNIQRLCRKPCRLTVTLDVFK